MGVQEQEQFQEQEQEPEMQQEKKAKAKTGARARPPKSDSRDKTNPTMKVLFELGDRLSLGQGPGIAKYYHGSGRYIALFRSGSG